MHCRAPVCTTSCFAESCDSVTYRCSTKGSVAVPPSRLPHMRGYCYKRGLLQSSPLLSHSKIQCSTTPDLTAAQSVHTYFMHMTRDRAADASTAGSAMQGGQLPCKPTLLLSKGR